MNQKLISVEIQKEFDVLNKGWQEQVFVKLYVAARTSGFLADISDRDWKTLCVLATFMDTQGNCYPSQVQIAKALGVSRQAANERINSLLRYRWQGKPVVLVTKVRKKNVNTGKKGDRWDNNRYTILPLSNLVLGQEHEKPVSATDDIGKGNEKPMSSDHDIGKSLDFTEKKPMSPYPDTGKDDTNNICCCNVVVVDKPSVEKSRKENVPKNFSSDEQNNNNELWQQAEKVCGVQLPPKLLDCLVERKTEETTGSSVTNSRAVFNFSERVVSGEENKEKLWEKIRKDVRAVAGQDITVQFAKHIAKKYTPEQLSDTLKELENQLRGGLVLKKGIGHWLNWALQNDIKPIPDTVGQPRQQQIRTMPKQQSGQKRSKARGPDDEARRKKELVRSLYLS
ncbi:helix-turn-helix domain-containing protein [Desulfoscipio geothermicus]|uniref:Helix-turn-helix domain-containing protein n=1 Tax=Desulfoscipio geothermicus DSM 3669 TaxID=1121426 RepID=A0A1I6EBU7_9FIRM|nr:helix-turn-helix domain-containing protein [Desulfoscipio geothermicus]SFR15022.1 Helix-turn-helix domain-containing protein [Desulfoscipio geothermicus DSM 3669]